MNTNGATLSQVSHDYTTLWILATIYLATAYCMQPHVCRRVRPTQLLPLPWDREKTQAEAQELTAGERQRRFEDALLRLDAGI